MSRFRTRLLAAAGVTAGFFAITLLAAMQSAGSHPVGAKSPEFAASGATACARAVERWADAGYYQAEYTARRLCDPAAIVR